MHLNNGEALSSILVRALTNVSLNNYSIVLGIYNKIKT